jgi:A/G-specific adenine glycosylase
MAASDKFASDLLVWFGQHGRHDLPWQAIPPNPPNVYHVWLSEIMLQQTQVATVIPYFKKFTAAFPTLAALASADEHQVLNLWSGLGYYARARNLLACAQQIMNHHAGQFPKTAAALAQLPGIGRSTAAAIAATVFHERVAILDGNVKRVLARLTCAPAPWASPQLDRMLWHEAAMRMPKTAADMPAYTQAVMDLGATVCQARKPNCIACPVQRHCKAFKTKQVADYPKPRVKKTTPQRQAHWCVLMNDHAVWLNQQPSPGIWGGLWAPWLLDLNAMPKDWPVIAQSLVQVIDFQHSFTHFRLQVSAGVVHLPRLSRSSQLPQLPQSSRLPKLPRLPKGAPKTLTPFLWSQVFDQPLPTPVKKLLLRLCPSETTSGDAQRKKKRS